ncbi:MAG TPA: response regulator [Nitrososphaeraceae archaeon]|nr:response regulator [Nitrososphaeraceae archaeon]
MLTNGNDNKNTTNEVNTSLITKNTTSTKKPSYRILYVDDDLDILFSIKTGLEYYGFIVDTFSNPLEALSTFKPELYDLVLVDIKMPLMSGFEFHQELRKKALYGTEIKTCFITAYEIYFETLRKEFPELYDGCFIRKPIKIDDLVNKINEELSQKI